MGWVYDNIPPGQAYRVREANPEISLGQHFPCWVSQVSCKMLIGQRIQWSNKVGKHDVSTKSVF